MVGASASCFQLAGLGGSASRHAGALQAFTCNLWRPKGNVNHTYKMTGKEEQLQECSQELLFRL